MILIIKNISGVDNNLAIDSLSVGIVWLQMLYALKTKSMFKKLDANPNCEIVVATPDFAWLRITGKLEFTDSLT